MPDRFRRCVRLPMLAGGLAALIFGIAAAQPTPSQPLTTTVWGPPEDPALVCAQADQSRTLKPTEVETVFTYRVTNVSGEDVVVLNVISSCSCATPKHPPTP